MAVTIRLTRLGKKHEPHYRVIVLDKRKKRDGSYIEQIGTYNPHLPKNGLSINAERFAYWKSRGAELSECIRKLLHSNKIA